MVNMKFKIPYLNVSKNPSNPQARVEVDAEDSVHMLARMQSGSVGIIEASKLATGTEDELRLIRKLSRVQQVSSVAQFHCHVQTPISRDICPNMGPLVLVHGNPLLFWLLVNFFEGGYTRSTDPA